MGDDRASVYVEGDNVVYRASSLGNCIAELAGIRFGLVPAPFPAQFRKVFADGHRGEDVIIAKLEARGFTITRRQEEINWPILPGVILRGHIDGVSQYLDEKPRVFDAKTTTKKSGISAHLKQKYDLQLSVYGHALGLDRAMLGVGVKDPDTGDVVGEIECENIDALPVSVAQIKARIAKIERYAAAMRTAADLPACDTEQQYPCGLFAYHEDEKPVTIRRDAEVDEMFDGLMSEYDAAKIDEGIAKALKDDAKARIIAHVGGKVDKATGEWELSFTGTGLKKKLDEKALARFLKAYGKTPDEFYGTVSAEKSISVKRVVAGAVDVADPTDEFDPYATS